MLTLLSGVLILDNKWYSKYFLREEVRELKLQKMREESEARGQEDQGSRRPHGVRSPQGFKRPEEREIENEAEIETETNFDNDDGDEDKPSGKDYDTKDVCGVDETLYSKLCEVLLNREDQGDQGLKGFNRIRGANGPENVRRLYSLSGMRDRGPYGNRGIYDDVYEEDIDEDFGDRNDLRGFDGSRSPEEEEEFVDVYDGDLVEVAKDSFGEEEEEEFSYEELTGSKDDLELRDPKEPSGSMDVRRIIRPMVNRRTTGLRGSNGEYVKSINRSKAGGRKKHEGVVDRCMDFVSYSFDLSKWIHVKLGTLDLVIDEVCRFNWNVGLGMIIPLKSLKHILLVFIYLLLSNGLMTVWIGIVSDTSLVIYLNELLVLKWRLSDGVCFMFKSLNCINGCKLFRNHGKPDDDSDVRDVSCCFVVVMLYDVVNIGHGSDDVLMVTHDEKDEVQRIDYDVVEDEHEDEEEDDDEDEDEIEDELEDYYEVLMYDNSNEDVKIVAGPVDVFNLLVGSEPVDYLVNDNDIVELKTVEFVRLLARESPAGDVIDLWFGTPYLMVYRGYWRTWWYLVVNMLIDNSQTVMFDLEFVIFERRLLVNECPKVGYHRWLSRSLVHGGQRLRSFYWMLFIGQTYGSLFGLRCSSELDGVDYHGEKKIISYHGVMKGDNDMIGDLRGRGSLYYDELFW